MKKLTFTTLILCFLVMGQACNDLLDNADPSDATDPAIILEDPATIEALRADMYDTFHGFTFTTRMFLGPAALADNTDLRPSATRFQSLNINSDNNTVRAGLNDGSYNTVYDLILTANVIINSIPEGVLDEETENQYVGEALTLRAFAMHYLVKVLGYEPGMIPDSGPGAGFEQGIIIRTEPVESPEEVKVLPRDPVTAVYDQIISDLDQAITLLPPFTKYIASRSFAQAILARVHLYAGNYAEADDLATQAIATAGGGVILADDPQTVADLFDETSANHPGAFLVIDTEPSTESLGVNDAINVYTENQWLAQIPTQSLISLYPEGDYRLGWYDDCFNQAGNTDITNCTAVNSQGWEIEKWSAEQGQYADDYPLIRSAELKLIQAEARYRTSGAAAGLVPLNELRAARGLAALTAADLSLTAQQQQINPGLEPFIAEILVERRRELAVEGHRFFDLKRLGLNVPFPNGTMKINYNSHKILDNIGNSELETNPELVQNPGY